VKRRPHHQSQDEGREAENNKREHNEEHPNRTMLRSTPSLLTKNQYYHKFMEFPCRRWKSRYLQPRNPQMRTPLAHKDPEEYSATDDQRVGIEWYHRLRRRGLFRTGPKMTWQHDPVRQHRAPPSRCFSATASASLGAPLWDHYRETGQDYRLDNAAPLTALAPVLNTYIGAVWRREASAAMLERLGAKFGDVENINRQSAAVRAWNAAENAVPQGFVQHVLLLARDVVRLNALKAYRGLRHAQGNLRTTDMERYYAVPHHRGAAMPTTLEQVPGAEPVGVYTNMLPERGFIHPLHRPDGMKKRNYMPM
jgi:hypothetical protein